MANNEETSKFWITKHIMNNYSCFGRPWWPDGLMAWSWYPNHLCSQKHAQTSPSSLLNPGCWGPINTKPPRAAPEHRDLYVQPRHCPDPVVPDTRCDSSWPGLGASSTALTFRTVLGWRPCWYHSVDENESIHLYLCRLMKLRMDELGAGRPSVARDFEEENTLFIELHILFWWKLSTKNDVQVCAVLKPKKHHFAYVQFFCFKSRVHPQKNAYVFHDKWSWQLTSRHKVNDIISHCL